MTPAATRAAGGQRWKRRARAAALQMLYQWEVGRQSMDDVAATYWEVADPGEQPDAAVREFAEALARGTAAHLPEVDPVIEERAEHWRLERMPVVDRLILRMAVHEFLFAPETPRVVVIDEALELARRFSADEAVGFINGVLDGIRRRLDVPVAGPAAETS